MQVKTEISIEKKDKEFEKNKGFDETSSRSRKRNPSSFSKEKRNFLRGTDHLIRYLLKVTAMNDNIETAT